MQLSITVLFKQEQQEEERTPLPQQSSKWPAQETSGPRMVNSPSARAHLFRTWSRRNGSASGPGPRCPGSVDARGPHAGTVEPGRNSLTVPKVQPMPTRPGPVHWKRLERTAPLVWPDPIQPVSIDLRVSGADSLTISKRELWSAKQERAPVQPAASRSKTSRAQPGQHGAAVVALPEVRGG